MSCFSHLLSGLSFFQSKCHTSLAKVNLISAQASDLPRQSRGPYENGWKALASCGTIWMPPFSRAIQRSGMNASGWAKFRGDRKMEKYGIPTEVWK